MAVELKSVGVSPGADSTTCVVARPSGLSVGDLMLAHITSHEGGLVITPPDGWTQIRQDVSDHGFRSGLFWKIADSDDVSASDFTFTVGDNANIGAITAWTGHDPDSPIGAHSGQYNSYYYHVLVPSITPAAANSLILLFGVSRNNVTFSNYLVATDNPGTWTEAYDHGTSLGSDCSQCMGYALRPETSATGQGDITPSSQTYNIGNLIAITPSSGGGADKTASETGSGVDGSAISAAAAGSETGQGSDARLSFLAGLVKSDNGAGAEALQVISAALSAAEAGTGADVLSLFAGLFGDESGTAVVEQGTLSLVVSAADSGGGIETLAAQLADILNTEGGSGTESVVGRAVVFGESGSGLDALSALLAALVRGETGSGAEQGLLISFVEKLASETGSGNDAAGLLAALAAVESGLGADSGWLVGLKIIFAGDAGAGLETLKALVESSRAGTDMKLPGRAGQVKIPSRGVSL